jgi:hypothetical protein
MESRESIKAMSRQALKILVDGNCIVCDVEVSDKDWLLEEPWAKQLYYDLLLKYEVS